MRDTASWFTGFLSFSLPFVTVRSREGQWNSSFECFNGRIRARPAIGPSVMIPWL